LLVVDDDGTEFLSAEQADGYGRFTGVPSVEDLERYFFLDDTDLKLVRAHRGRASRLGFALQLTTVRYVGTFLDGPTDVPQAVLEYLAEQLAVRKPAAVVRDYLMREMTRFEHRWEICEVDGWCDFAQARDELARWVDRRAWTTGDGPKSIFDGAVGWLRHRRVLLPAVDTVTGWSARLSGPRISGCGTRWPR
jgi:hypothetical protein